ncbi:MAG: DUF6049 family protein [Pseudolysinimonas sp.]
MTRLRTALAAGLVAAALGLAAPASASPLIDPPDPSLAPAAVTAGSGPVSVAVVVPLTVPPTVTGLLDAETLATYTAQGGILDRELDAVAGTPAAVGLDPMITASIQVLGSSAPATALAFLDRLRGIPNEVFVLAYADADPALAAVAGTAGQLQPLGFDSLLDPANFGPAATPSATPSAEPTSSPTPDATTPPDDDAPPPLPTTDDLLAWPASLPAIAWPAEGTITTAGLEGLADQGYADVLIAEENVSATPTALVDLGDVDGLVIDDAVTAALRSAAYAATDLEYSAAQVTLAAALKAAVITSPGRTIVAALDRRWPFGELRLPEALSAIQIDASAQLVGLSAVLAGSKNTATLVEPLGDVQADRAETISQLSVAATEEASYLVIADDATVIVEPRRLALLGLSSVGWRTDDPAWQDATATALSAAQSTLDAVQIVDGSDQLLLSGISSLRLQVSNALPVAVTVRVTVRPLRPLLHIETPSVDVTIEPDSTATAAIPVEAIINGDVTVRAELHASSGTMIAPARFFKVIVQAGWETVGTVVAGALLVAIFGGGLVRSILRRRREAAGDIGAGSDD